MYLYETHLHTAPVSACARASVKESLAFYRQQGYAGVFITDHFIDGNINIDRKAPFEERIEFYFSSYEEGLREGKGLGLQVFSGVEMSYRGTDFLIYGLDKAWYLSHPEIQFLPKSTLLQNLQKEGALVIQAHPFRRAGYIDHIRLFPDVVHGVETYNACRDSLTNRMAELYAKEYDLIPFAGTDNHVGMAQKKLGGMMTETPLKDEKDFVQRVLDGTALPFRREAEK